MPPRLVPSLLLVSVALTLTLTAFAVRPGIATRSLPPTNQELNQRTESNEPSGVVPDDFLQFTSRGHILGFAADAVYIAGRSHSLRVQFVNARSTKPTSAAAPYGAQRAVPLSQVAYPNLWDGVTLTYDAPNGAVLRSTYRVEPHANAGNIRLRYNAPVTLQDDGSLRVSFNTGTISESAPIAWQEPEGKRIPVQVAFAMPENGEVTFAVGEYDRSQPLFIDPTLVWNTFLGGASNDEGHGLAVDAVGNVYVTGYSLVPWGTPLSGPHGSADAFLAKLDSNGNLIWSTFIGGSGDDLAAALAIDVGGERLCHRHLGADMGKPFQRLQRRNL